MSTPPETSPGSDDNYDPIAELGFDENEAALLQAMLNTLGTGQATAQPNPGTDWEVISDDEGLPTTAETSDDNNVPTAKCPLCDEEIWAPDGTPLQPTVRCSWSGCRGHSTLMHAACPPNPWCPACGMNMLVQVTGPDSPPGQRIPRSFPVQARSASWDPSQGVPQVGMLCYAAAAATACRFAGLQTTLLESMHRYAYSLGNEQSWAKGYRLAYDEAKMYLEIKNTNPSVDSVLGRVKDKKPEAYNSATQNVGSPAFPPEMDGKLAYPANASMTSSALFNLINSDKVVMAGDSVHWVVIYACFGSAPDDINFIEFYDPSGGTVVTQKWPTAYMQFIVVG